MRGVSGSFQLRRLQSALYSPGRGVEAKGMQRGAHRLNGQPPRQPLPAAAACPTRRSTRRRLCLCQVLKAIEPGCPILTPDWHRHLSSAQLRANSHDEVDKATPATVQGARCSRCVCCPWHPTESCWATAQSRSQPFTAHSQKRGHGTTAMHLQPATCLSFFSLARLDDFTIAVQNVGRKVQPDSQHMIRPRKEGAARQDGVAEGAWLHLSMGAGAVQGADKACEKAGPGW